MIDVNVKLGHWPYRPLRGPDSLLETMDAHGIARAVVSSLNALFYLNPQDGNDEVAAWAKPHRDRLIPLAVLRPNFTGWQDDLTRCIDDYGMKGVVLYPNYHRFDLSDPSLEPLMEVAAHRHLPVCVQMTLEDPRRQFDREIVEDVPVHQLEEFVAAYHGVTVIGLGLKQGQPHQVGDPLPRNFRFDLSNFEGMGKVEEALDAFGAGRILFGTNYPLFNTLANVDKLAKAAIPAAARKAISRGNAEDAFGGK
jgi:uncharacterized protein